MRRASGLVVAIICLVLAAAAWSGLCAQQQTSDSGCTYEVTETVTCDENGENCTHVGNLKEVCPPERTPPEPTPPEPTPTPSPNS
jgi:hypothetical protein